MLLVERLLALATGAIVAICLGVGLVLMALGPERKAEERRAATPVETAAPVETTAPVESPARADIAAPAEYATADAHATARDGVEETIADAREYRPFFERLRRAFPSDYDAAIESFASERLTRAEAPPSVDFYAAETVRRLRQSRGVLASRADPNALGRVFDLHLDMLRALSQEDKRLCAAFLYGGVDQGFHGFAARRRSLVGEMALVGLEAIVSGQDKSAERAPPSEEDFRALEKALSARGLRKTEIDQLLDGKTPDPPLNDDKTCAIGLTYLESVRALPEPVRLRLYGLMVELMARS
jgi:hypothetical protein